MATLQNLLPCLCVFLANLVSTVFAKGPAEVPLVSSVSPEQPNFTFARLYDLQVKFYDAFLWPANLEQMAAINSTLLAEDVIGRIDITRNFEGRELNTEYLFGLFAQSAQHPEIITLVGVPVSYEIIHFTANQYITSAAVRLQFNFTSLGLTVPVEIDSWNTYNEAGEITQFDVTFRYWQWLVDHVITASAPKVGATSPEEAITKLGQLVAQGVCSTHQMYCTGGNTQYADFNACLSYLTNATRFGQAYELGRDTLLCRSLHRNMVPYRPEVHCPHIGPAGGGMCGDEMDYPGTVASDIFPVPYKPYGY
ncbi:hypothetical protein BJ878DRAFT_95672 [Calycina marina]|uniref:Secreted protein n=1 Tax=Calycina marina TaxID=1763456 RepID=A0A9P7Z271_9HELO|nr:hypothetical protein BJ878DRAFT_95672 [Calycina marina]